MCVIYLYFISLLIPKILLNRDCGVNKYNSKGYTPLAKNILLMFKNSPVRANIVERLLSHGESLQTCVKNGRIAWECCKIEGYYLTTVLKFLFNYFRSSSIWICLFKTRGQWAVTSGSWKPNSYVYFEVFYWLPC
jgi:hypothetical protein